MQLVTLITTTFHLEASRVEACFRAPKVISQTARTQIQVTQDQIHRTLQLTTKRRQISQECHIQAQLRTTLIIQQLIKLVIPHELNRQLYHREVL